MPSEPWFLDKLSLQKDGSDTRVEVSGWAFPDPELGQSTTGLFLLNGKPFPEIQAAQQAWFQCDPDRELPLPDEGRRFRVIGTNDVNDFRRGGFTDFKRLEAAIRFFSGKGFSPGQRILDFGCGCGRVARYTSQMPAVKVTGIDIDADNVAWCTVKS